MPDIYAITDELMEVVDDRTAPPGLTKHQAVDVLELMRDAICSRLEALREELQNETV